VRLRVLSPELPAPVRQRHANLLPEGSAADQPRDLVLLQEAVAPSLTPDRRPRLQLLQERQLPLPHDLEAGQVEFTDLGRGDPEDLAQRGVGHLGAVVMGGDLPPELQLNQVGDLLLAQRLLHLRFDFLL